MLCTTGPKAAKGSRMQAETMLLSLMLNEWPERVQIHSVVLQD